MLRSAKTKYLLIIFLSVVVMFLAAGCGGNSADKIADAVDGPGIINDTGGNGDGDGMVVHDGVIEDDKIILSEGTINILIDDNGEAELDNTTLNLMDQDDNGDWFLADDVSILLTDDQGKTINLTPERTVITGDDGTEEYYLTLTPDVLDALDADRTYELNLTVGEDDYIATIHLSVDDMDDVGSLFREVQHLGETGTFSPADLMSNGYMVYGWEFMENAKTFKISYKNAPAGSTVLLTAYGIYDIEGHTHEVYYQRWKNSGDPVRDYEWNGGTLSVDASDITLDYEDIDYSFWRTYLKVIIRDDSGQDITSQSDDFQLVVE